MDTRETLSLRLRVGVVCLVICIAHAASIQVVAQNGEEILVDDERPLAAAAKAIEKRCHCGITYEDVKWGPDQVTISPVGRSRSDGAPRMIPRGFPFRFMVPSNLAQMSSKEVAQSLGAVLSEFEASQNPGQFKLVQGQTSFHILPARSAVSENRVSVTADDTPAGNVVQTIIKELTRVSGAQIGVWRQPLNLMKRRIRVDLASEPAYEVLSRVLQAVDSRLSWHLFYDVNLNTYLLTIYRPQS